MKITIDCSIKKITKVEQSPIYFGNNNVDKIVLSFINTSSISLDWYPSLSAVGPDKNPIYPRSYDTDGITSANGITNYDFTLSNANGWNLIAGKHLFYVWINYPDTNGNECVGSFACTILVSSGYYMIDNPVVNPSLRQYLENSFEEHYNDVDARFEELQEDFNDEYTAEVNAQRSAINNLIGGQPRYVSSSGNILALTTNQGVAVGTDTQKWYYWNGTQYVVGGDYPGVAGYDELKNLIDYTKEVYDNTSSYLINNTAYTKTGGIVSSSNYKTFAWIPVHKGDVILYTGANGTNTDIGLINGYYNGSRENFISNLLQVVSGENSNNKLIKITNENVKFITASFRTAENVSYSLVIYRKNKSVITDYSHLFNKVACIGDSLTRGYYVNSQSVGVDGSPHYPYFLAKMNNWQYINAGVSGSTPQSWLQNGYVTGLDYSSCDICFICFGRNGNIAEEEYRYYFKNLIDWLREKNSTMFIFLMSIPFRDDSTENLFYKQQYIMQIANEKNCYYLDTNTIMYPDTGNIYRPNDGIHYNRLGYYTRAIEVNSALSRFIESNKEIFAQWLQN